MSHGMARELNPLKDLDLLNLRFMLKGMTGLELLGILANLKRSKQKALASWQRAVKRSQSQVASQKLVTMWIIAEAEKALRDMLPPDILEIMDKIPEVNDGT